MGSINASTGWHKSNCDFALLNFSVWSWNTFLNIYGYVIHHFNAHFLLYGFFFFANDITYCVFYAYFRLGKLFFEFKMGCKAGETTLNINNPFSPGTANEHTGQWWFKKFCKKVPWRWGVQWLAIRSDNNHLRAIIKAHPFTTTWEVAKELNINHSTIFNIWSKLERWKKLNKWVLHELIKILKNHCFEESSSLILCNKEPFLNWIVTWDKKWILKDNQW